MLKFIGHEHCLVDSAGRIRLTKRFVEDFRQVCGGELVLHGLPEGAIALYPEKVYAEMRAKELAALDSIGTSFATRRSLRRFGALTAQDVISPQGRISLPLGFQQYAGLFPGVEACVVGVEIGVEIWNAEKFATELGEINQHLRQKAQNELALELKSATTEE